MRTFARLTTRGLCLSAAVFAFGVPTLRAQESVLVSCSDQKPCTFERVYAATLQGRDSVKVVPANAMGAEQLKKGRSVRLASLTGLYREPGSGLLRVMSLDGQLGDAVLPAKFPSGAVTPAIAAAGSVVEYQVQPTVKSRGSVPIARFVALLNGQPLAAAVVGFVRNEMKASVPHPQQAGLLKGGLAFAANSSELREWQDQLHGAMQQGFDDFKAERADPARLEATLKAGVDAARVFNVVAPDGQKDEALQRALVEEHDRLLKRYAIAAALKNAGMTDPYLDKLEQIGLARWSRPALLAAVKQSLKDSADVHSAQAKQFLSEGDARRAFDEAGLASARVPCDPDIGELYRNARDEFVKKNMGQGGTNQKDNEAAAESALRQIGAFKSQTTWTPERVLYFRNLIAKAEDSYGDSLALQAAKAEFLETIGELSGSRDVVIHVERTVPMDRTTAKQWLDRDGRLGANLDLERIENGTAIRAKIQSGQFSEALASVKKGLTAEPGNLHLLYWGAVAAAVQRDQQTARAFVLRYLKSMSLECSPQDNGTEKTLFELFRRPTASVADGPTAGRTPNWVSGESYEPGEVFYDPLSGSFQPRVQLSMTNKAPVSSTEFEWDGNSVKSITTRNANQFGTVSRVEFQVEPVYDGKRVYMGSLRTSGGRVIPLKYINSPDYDPQLAQQFTGKRTARGWAGNPFFHPFLWKDIFLFDLEYDELGRIRQAVPVTQETSRQGSRFSEPLTFIWDGNSKRLLEIKGTSYRRKLEYDDRHRLVSEKITVPNGSGRIDYRYIGDSMQLREAECEDNFYGKDRRRVSFLVGGQ
jgi:hypothetical protein